MLNYEFKRIWVDLGELGASDTWQDHGIGVLRTIMHSKGIMTEIASTRCLNSWDELAPLISGFDMLLMNVRSYTFPFACQVAKTFKQVNPSGMVIVGGMHATVALKEMQSVEEFDYICSGGGENVICDIAKDPKSFPRVIHGVSANSLSEWPQIDRTLWPNPNRADYPWPLEPSIGWGPPPVATVITSRVCPWACSFCNELSYIPLMSRRTVDQVIEELNFLDNNYGPLGSVVIHDSMFFQQPSWLEEWLEKYPKKANKVWPYWAAARSDTVRKWPELFEALVRETNWHTISIGFESGSDRVLKILNKGCTVEDNAFAINLLNKIGDDYMRMGKEPPKFWANLIFASPGESHEDAFNTVRMLKKMKYVLPSIAYFGPYPGSALGNQLIAEGKSLMTKDDYHRYPGIRKLKGIDYDFYERLLSGFYEDKIVAGLEGWGKDGQ
jgi:radical SAM superfamily enzyme YgiQ (UPF0313 family)